jgi:hypothetical protein
MVYRVNLQNEVRDYLIVLSHLLVGSGSASYSVIRVKEITREKIK